MNKGSRTTHGREKILDRPLPYQGRESILTSHTNSFLYVFLYSVPDPDPVYLSPEPLVPLFKRKIRLTVTLR